MTSFRVQNFDFTFVMVVFPYRPTGVIGNGTLVYNKINIPSPFIQKLMFPWVNLFEFPYEFHFYRILKVHFKRPSIRPISSQQLIKRNSVFRIIIQKNQ